MSFFFRHCFLNLYGITAKISRASSSTLTYQEVYKESLHNSLMRFFKNSTANASEILMDIYLEVTQKHLWKIFQTFLLKKYDVFFSKSSKNSCRNFYRDNFSKHSIKNTHRNIFTVSIKILQGFIWKYSSKIPPEIPSQILLMVRLGISQRIIEKYLAWIASFCFSMDSSRKSSRRTSRRGFQTSFLRQQ